MNRKRLVSESIATLADDGDEYCVPIVVRGISDMRQKDSQSGSVLEDLDTRVQSRSKEQVTSAVNHSDQLFEDHGSFNDGFSTSREISCTATSPIIERSGLVCISANKVEPEIVDILVPEMSKSQTTEVDAYNCTICNNLFDSHKNACSHVIQRHKGTFANNQVAQIGQFAASSIRVVRVPTHQLRYKCSLCGIIKTSAL